MIAFEPRRIGNRYLLHRQIGAGGMGTVYEATDRLVGQMVALKQIRATNSADDIQEMSLSQRLALSREFQTLASLRHPNVINVLDYGFDEARQPYFTMPFLDSAQSIDHAAKYVAFTEKIQLLIQVLQALVYLHRQGIVHRDLKPDNALVTLEGQVKVLDFGLAQGRLQDDSHEFAGTPIYIAPELWQGNDPSVTSDLYAVGIIAYILFTGYPPYKITDTLQTFINGLMALQPDMSVIEAIALDGHQSEPSGAADQKAPPAGTNIPSVLAEPHKSGPAGTVIIENTTVPKNTVILEESSAPSDMNSEPFTTILLTPGITSVRKVADTQPKFNAFTTHPLAIIINRLLAKQPVDRYQDARQVITDLKALIGETVSPESADLRESFLQGAKFIGREAELTKLLEAVDEARHEHGSLWLVGGESGVGKSRLLDELRIRAIVQGRLVLRGQAISEGGSPYQLWLEPLRRLLLGVDIDNESAGILQAIVPDIGQLVGREVQPAPELDGKASEQRLLVTIKNLFQTYFHTAVDGVVVILEDLQWAGKSLEVIKTLGQLLSDCPLLILGSYRQDESPNLPQKLPGSHELKLNRLNETHVAELSVSILGPVGGAQQVVDFLQRETEGNVFFLVEVLRALADESGQLDHVVQMTSQPSIFANGVKQIIQRRLEQVPVAYRPLLNLAAVAGRNLDLPLLTQLATELPIDDWLTVCVNAAVFDFQDGHWRFAHDKLREWILTDLPAERRRELHRQVAVTLESLYADTLPQHVHELAHHWSQTDNRVKELQYSFMAGQQSLQLDAYNEAARLLQRALAIIEPMRADGLEYQTQEIEINIALGRTYEFLGSYDPAKEYLGKALTLAQETNSIHRATALFRLGWLAMREGNSAQARQFSSDAATMIRQADNPKELARIEHLIALTYLIQGDNERATEHLATALPMARGVNDLRTVANILNAYGEVSEKLGQFDEAQRYMVEASAIASKIGFKSLFANIEANIGHLSYTQQLYEKAKAHFERAIGVFREIRSIFGEAQVLCYLGLIEIALEQDNPAWAYLRSSVQLSSKINAVPVILIALCGVAKLSYRLQHQERTTELLSFILHHSASDADIEIEQQARPLFNQLKAEMTPGNFDAAVERGKAQELSAVVAEVLAFVI